jgi:hypothetical protein
MSSDEEFNLKASTRGDPSVCTHQARSNVAPEMAIAYGGGLERRPDDLANPFVDKEDRGYCEEEVQAVLRRLPDRFRDGQPGRDNQSDGGTELFRGDGSRLP